MQSSRRSTTLDVEQGHTILLAGPAQIKLSKGTAELFGAPIRLESWTAIEGGQQEPILATDKCTLEVEINSGGSWKEVNESTIPKGWEEATHIVHRQKGVVAIVGDVDSGKSSLCRFIANNSLREGLHVGVVDGDVGQADIGPPATISSGVVLEPILSLHELRSKISFFAGDTSPSAVPDKVIRSISRLKRDLANGNEVVLVNTDGWISDPAARRFKENLLQELQPDLVLGLDREGEINPLLDMIQLTSLRLSSSRYARSRTKDERKSAREKGYRRFLVGSKLTKITQERTILRTFDEPSQSILRWERRFNGLLSGLLDDEQRLLGIGRVREMSDGFALVETLAQEQPKFLEVGNVILSNTYEEIGYRSLH